MEREEQRKRRKEEQLQKAEKKANKNSCVNKNKRAQRALGRSPEEKVKGQGKAIYRGPLMLSTKYW